MDKLKVAEAQRRAIAIEDDLRPIQKLGLAIADAGITWTGPMRAAYLAADQSDITLRYERTNCTCARRHSQLEAEAMKRVCKVCGETDHHEPEWLTIPDGCVCDWREWNWAKLDAIPPACAKYVGDGSDNCERCEHDPDCHRGDT